MIVNKNFLYVCVVFIFNLIFSGCSISDTEAKKIHYETTMTPIQKCKKESGKYNLIVNSPIASRVRILNIKPVYEDCIALNKGSYLIEVTKFGFLQYKKWILIDKDTELDVNLKKIVKPKLYDTSEVENLKLEDAGYNSKKLQTFIYNYPNSTKTLTAKQRLGVIKYKFKGYSPEGLFIANNCKSFYPKKLVENKLKFSTNLDYWRSIEWNGGCKKGLMSGRGTLRFMDYEGLSVELKGKMLNGFFEGKVYNHTKSLESNSVKVGGSKGYDSVKLRSKADFKLYQE